MPSKEVGLDRAGHKESLQVFEQENNKSLAPFLDPQVSVLT